VTATAPSRTHDPAGRARALRRPPAIVLLIAGCVAVAALTLLLPGTPSYDPWSWIGWGRDVIQLDLDTVNGPSWKPLPVLLTTLFAPFGSAAPALWLVTARAGGLLSIVLAFRVARRIAGEPFGWVAGLIAALGVVLLRRYWITVAGGFSEGIGAALLLGAIDAHLRGRTRLTVWLLFGTALLRPESWPIAGAYWLWVWLRHPERRRELVALCVALPIVWFLPELIGSGDLLRGQKRAQLVTADQPSLHEHPFLEFARRAFEMFFVPIELGAMAAIGFAAAAWRRRREQRETVVIAAAALAWLVLVGVMAQFGYSGNTRYVAPVAAVVCVLGGVGWYRIGAALARRVPRPRAAVAVLALAALAASYPFARSSADRLGSERAEFVYESDLNHDLRDAVDRAGGADRVKQCGPITTEPYRVPALTWLLDAEIEDLGLKPGPTGIEFRAKPTATARPAPRRAASYATVARAGHWEVLARCTNGRLP
jgi:hypothetical protein